VDCDEYLSCNSGSLQPQRFPGKPLVMIEDRPMVQWFMKQPSCPALVVVVATDSTLIAVRKFVGQW